MSGCVYTIFPSISSLLLSVFHCFNSIIFLFTQYLPIQNNLDRLVLAWISPVECCLDTNTFCSLDIYIELTTTVPIWSLVDCAVYFSHNETHGT